MKMMKMCWIRVVLICMLLSVSVGYAQNTAGLTALPAGISGYPPVPFPTDKSFLIYTTDNGDLVAAMNYYGLSYTARSASNPVTSQDLATHDILIVGWNTGTLATMNGLSPSVLYNGITGRVILTGHDADYHVPHTPDAGNVIFEETIKYVLAGEGTGMVAFTDSVSDFSWLPESWGVTGDSSTGETIESITPQGVASGIFANLTPALLSGWGVSYHNYFTAWGNGFEPFELADTSALRAVTIGTPINAYGFEFAKADDVAESGCVSPAEGDDNDITYSICWKNISGRTFTDVRIVDYLPVGVDYPAGWDRVDANLNIIAGDPNYSQEDHTYTWHLGTSTPVEYDPNNPDDGRYCVSLDVVVNENAIAGMTLHNVAEIIGTFCVDTPDPNDPNNSVITTCDELVIASATEDTPVCCWGNDSTIIYVSANATGACTGNSWADAYNTQYGLNMALERAVESTCTGPFTILVAQGTYLPGTKDSDSFDIPDGTKVYGGFPAKGCVFEDRDPKKYTAVLSGDLSDIATSNTVVNMGQDALLEGVTVTDGFDYNVSGNYFTIKNCVIENSFHYGIYSEYGDVTVKSCMIRNNGADGIYQEGLDQTLNVSNSWVMRNGTHGIYCLNTTPIVKNSIVSESDLANEGRAGISIVNPAASPVLHNVTISNNKSLGVQFFDTPVINDPNDPNDCTIDYPSMENCILFYNNKSNGTYGSQVSGMNIDTVASYCCVQGCVAGNGRNNINDIPMFAYPVDPAGEPDPANYHIAFNSVCIDKGNPNLVYDDQIDYDNESRVEGLYVDLGADEVYVCNGDYSVSNSLDTNFDGLINMVEFQPLADGWLSLDPNDPRWISDPNFANPNATERWNEAGNIDDTGDSQFSIDMADLELFCENWLWKACWYESANSVETATVMTESVTLMPTSSVSTLSAKTTGVASLARATSTLLIAEDTTVEEYNFYESLSNTELAQVVKDFRYLQENIEDMLEHSPADCEDKEDLLDLLVFFDDELAKIKESLQ